MADDKATDKGKGKGKGKGKSAKAQPRAMGRKDASGFCGVFRYLPTVEAAEAAGGVKGIARKR